MLSTATSTRSNQGLFIAPDTGSPHDGLMAHISGLGQIARLDFERCRVAGEVIFAVEGDSMPTPQHDEEARIGTLAYALNKFGNAEDAGEFTRCLNAICDESDARGRQVVASHYFKEIASRGTAEVLKEMALLAMQLSSLKLVTEISETDEPGVNRSGFDSAFVYTLSDNCDDDDFQFEFNEEVAAIERMICGRRKGTGFIHDECSEWLNDLEGSGASLEELDAAFTHAEAMEQYDEGGAILLMSSHERTVACGRIDAEFTSQDLPERTQHLVGQLRRDYAQGVGIDDIWEDINAQIEIIYPVSGRMENGARFYSYANRELQHFTRQVLEAMLDECKQDFHLTALRTNRTYRHFHQIIRNTTDTRIVSEEMKQAYEARLSGLLPLKHFAALKTVATLQRERLHSARLSQSAFNLIKEINTASIARLRYLSWAFYGDNQPSHPIHQLSDQERARVWEALKVRKEETMPMRMAA